MIHLLHRLNIFIFRLDPALQLFQPSHLGYWSFHESTSDTDIILPWTLALSHHSFSAYFSQSCLAPVSKVTKRLTILLQGKRSVAIGIS